MYLSYFGFSAEPFNLTPDSRFLFLSKRHQEALAALLYGIEQRKGFIALTGEIGCGKTTICRTLLGKLDREKVRLALVLNPELNDLELLQTINAEFGIEASSASKRELLAALNKFLLEEYAHDRNVVLVIDEAQRLSPAALEQVRLISNLETETTKLIQIALVGQPELGDLLDLPELEQLNQRITVRYHMGPLNFEELEEYLAHRIAVAEPRLPVRFHKKALRKVMEYSAGVPRRVNVLSDRALLVTFVREEVEVSEANVVKGIEELGGMPKRHKRAKAEEGEPATAAAAGPGSAEKGTSSGAWPVAAAVAIAFAAVAWAMSGMGKGSAAVAPAPTPTPAAVATPTPATSPAPQPTPTPAPAPTPTALVTPTPAPTPLPEEESPLDPNAVVEFDRSPTATPVPSPTPEPSPSASPTPVETSTASPMIAELQATPAPATPTPATAAAWSYDGDGVLRVPAAELAYPAAVMSWLAAAMGQRMADADLAALRAMPAADVAALQLTTGRPPLHLRVARLAPNLGILEPAAFPLLVQTDDASPGFGPWAVLASADEKSAVLLDPRNGRMELPIELVEDHVAALLAPFRDPEGLVGLKPLQQGESVRALQARLKAAGIYLMEPTAVYDAFTEAAVAKYRERAMMPGPSEVDAELARHLIAATPK